MVEQNTSLDENKVRKAVSEALKKGGVRAMLYFDMHTSSADMLQQLSVSFVKKMLEEEGVVYARGEIDKPMESEDKLISTSVQVEIVTRSFFNLLTICGKYTPFSLEIIEPDSIKLTVDEAHNVLMETSTSNFEYKRYILQKVASKEDVEKYKKLIKAKAELGKRLLERKTSGENAQS